MTKQEAIEYIKENCYGEWCEDEWREVHDMAIEALQQGCEKVAEGCEDLIRRQDAINVAKQHWYKPDIANALEELPSAQPDLLDDGTLMMTVPHGMLEKVKRVMVDEVGTKFCKVMYQDAERKKGRWIKISPANIYECSECGKNVMTDDISAYDFCHGCGAEMEGESNG